MRYLLFVGEHEYEPTPIEQMFRGVFATPEEAQAYAAAQGCYGGKIVAFDGVAMSVVCERPYWKRYTEGHIPTGHTIDAWGVSDR
jgi:hypothetical protein